MSDLSIKTTRGMFWSLAENFGLQGIQLIISIILARLLLPEQFGLIGMLTLFIALAQSLLDSGFGSALIQKKDADHLDACSVFYFNLLIGLVLTVLLCWIAPWIAQFYKEPILTPLTRFLSLSIIINAFGLVPSTMLNKYLDFKGLLIVSLISVVISGVVGISLALKGLGVWSLAVQAVLNTFIRAILLWLVSRWRPSRIFSKAALAIMFPFGSRMMFAGLLDTFFVNIYQPVIGKLYTAADLGYYVRAQTLQVAATQPTGIALVRVIFPALSPIQDDRPRLKNALQKITTIAVFFHFPLMIGLIVVAGALITLLMTERWAPSVPYFQLFCIVGFLYPLHVINLTVLTVTGRSDLFFRLEVIKKLMFTVALVITFRWGITAILYGQVAVSVIAYFLNSYYSGKLIGYSTIQQIRDVSPFLFISLLMGVSMYLVGSPFSSLFTKLLAQVCSGIFIYLALNIILKRSMLVEVIHLTRQAIHIPMRSLVK